MAYNNVGYRVGACYALIKTSTRLPLRGPRGETDPIAEDEGGDDRARRAHNDQSSGGRALSPPPPLSLDCTPSFFLAYKEGRTSSVDVLERRKKNW